MRQARCGRRRGPRRGAARDSDSRQRSRPSGSRDRGHGPVRGASWRESFALWEGEYLGAFSKICMSHTSAATLAHASPPPQVPAHQVREMSRSISGSEGADTGRVPSVHLHKVTRVKRAVAAPGLPPQVAGVEVRCSQRLRCFRLEFALGCNARDCGRGSGYQLRKP